jgi:hypothetical protein
VAELERIQAWMQGAVLAGGAAPEHAGAVVAPSPTLAPVERVAIYARGYRARLMEMLRGEFPALRRFTGDTVFDLFASSYIARHPSTRPSLFDFGAGFAGHLAASAPPEAAEPGSPLAIPAQLARLERARSEALRAAGVEAQVLPVTADCALVPGARLAVPGAVRLLRLAFDFQPLFACGDDGGPGAMPEARETRLAVSRSRWHVRMTLLDERRFRFLEALPGAGGTVHAAAARAAEATGGNAGAFLAELAVWLPAAGAAGLVARA